MFKAAEMSVVCGCEIAMVLFSPTGSLHTVFGSQQPVAAVLERLKTEEPLERRTAAEVRNLRMGECHAHSSASIHTWDGTHQGLHVLALPPACLPACKHTVSAPPLCAQVWEAFETGQMHIEGITDPTSKRPVSSNASMSMQAGCRIEHEQLQVVLRCFRPHSVLPTCSMRMGRTCRGCLSLLLAPSSCHPPLYHSTTPHPHPPTWCCPHQHPAR